MSTLASRMISKTKRYQRRKHRTNTITKVTSQKPRLIVNKSNRFLFVQIIGRDGNVIVSMSDRILKEGTKSEKAFALGEKVAKEALNVGCTTVVFDRNGNLFHGRVKQLAEGARAGGLSL